MSQQLPDELKQKILSELQASRAIVRDGLDVTPRWRILLTSGDCELLAPMYDDQEHRLSRLSIIKSYMLWRGADSFIMSAESIEPNAITCSLVTPDWVLSVYQIITLDPTNKPPHHVAFADVEGVGDVDPLLLELLPKPGEALTAAQTKEAEQLFGAGGRFEVRPVLH